MTFSRGRHVAAKYKAFTGNFATNYIAVGVAYIASRPTVTVKML